MSWSLAAGRRLLALAGVALPLVLAAPASAYTSDQPTSVGNPMAGYRWFVDWEWGMAQRAFLRYLAAGDWRKAQLMWKIARNPETKRFGRWTRRPRAEVRGYIRRLRRAEPGSYAFFYVYRLRHDGCAAPPRHWRGPVNAGWTAEGGREARRYRRWIRSFARGLGQQPATIFLEPDGLATMECVPRRFRGTRYRLLRYAIRRLRRDRNATIYLDGGGSDMVPARTAARRLRQAGVRRVRGFFLNSTRHDWTSSNVRYGDRLSRRLGGKHYVVSTAMNGRGPYRLRRRKRYFNEERCNPPGRALGEEPTVRTASPWADAYIWIGNPGRSGSNRCPHAGMPRAPKAGAFWRWYALDLAARTAWP